MEKIESSVEETQVNVIQAEQSLRKAAKLKKMSYPLIGAVVGSCVGGPLGCLAGVKVGVFATVTCFVLGRFKYSYLYKSVSIYLFYIKFYYKYIHSSI